MKTMQLGGNDNSIQIGIVMDNSGEQNCDVILNYSLVTNGLDCNQTCPIDTKINVSVGEFFHRELQAQQHAMDTLTDDDSLNDKSCDKKSFTT
jgi:hypothetical protein